MRLPRYWKSVVVTAGVSFVVAVIFLSLALNPGHLITHFRAPSVVFSVTPFARDRNAPEVSFEEFEAGMVAVPTEHAAHDAVVVAFLENTKSTTGYGYFREERRGLYLRSIEIQRDGEWVDASLEEPLVAERAFRVLHDAVRDYAGGKGYDMPPLLVQKTEIDAVELSSTAGFFRVSRGFTHWDLIAVAIFVSLCVSVSVAGFTALCCELSARSGLKRVGRCATCRYDLAGLPHSRPCPECGKHFNPKKS